VSHAPLALAGEALFVAGGFGDRFVPGRGKEFGDRAVAFAAVGGFVLAGAHLLGRGAHEALDAVAVAPLAAAPGEDAPVVEVAVGRQGVERERRAFGFLLDDDFVKGGVLGYFHEIALGPRDRLPAERHVRAVDERLFLRLREHRRFRRALFSGLHLAGRVIAGRFAACRRVFGTRLVSH
jgi:hypothetical protein